MIVDINKKYKTREGLDVDIYTITPAEHDLAYPVIGSINYPNEKRRVLYTWTLEGLNNKSYPTELDLIEVAPVITKYINVYFGINDDRIYIHDDRAGADLIASKDRTACIAVTYKENGELIRVQSV